MIGRNPLWVAKNHGHSVQTMLEKYAAWTEGATDADVEAIKQAMGFVSTAAPAAVRSTKAREGMSTKPQSPQNLAVAKPGTPASRCSFRRMAHAAADGSDKLGSRIRLSETYRNLADISMRAKRTHAGT